MDNARSLLNIACWLVSSSGCVDDGSPEHVGRFTHTCEGGFLTVMDDVVCRGRDSREHVVAGVQPRQSASGSSREQQQGARCDKKKMEGVTQVRLLLSALGFKSWELCDGKWPVHGFRFRREVWLGGAALHSRTRFSNLPA